MIVHLNGELLPRERATISPLDRGFVFGEGLYEGLRAIRWGDAGTRVVGLDLHIRRLCEGLAAAEMDFDPSCLGDLSEALLRANGLRDAFVYWQVSGGTPRADDPARSRVRPPGLRPTVFGYCNPLPAIETIAEPPTKRVITCRDIRWELGRIKATSLMGNVWAARRADQAGCEEAIFIRGDRDGPGGGTVSEGLATNIVIALPGGGGAGAAELATPSLDSAPMLAGVTRSLLLGWAPEIRERVVRADDLCRASEVMMVGTTTLVTSIVRIDGRTVGDGTPGPHSRRLLRLLIDSYLDGRDLAEPPVRTVAAARRGDTLRR